MSSLRDVLRATAFNAKVSLTCPSAFRISKELMKCERLPPDQLLALNWQRTRDIITYAYNYSPFYHRLYDEAGLDPARLADPMQLPDVPTVTKEDLRAHFRHVAIPGIARRHLRLSTTGGTTGAPLSVLHDRRFPVQVASWRALRWWDVSPSDDASHVYRLRHKYPNLNRVLWWPTRRVFLDASRLAPENIRAFLLAHNSVRPRILMGYVGALEEVARFIAQTKTTFAAPSVVWATSGPLGEPQRAWLEGIFRAPVFDQYGCCEVYWIAAECRLQRVLHAFSDLRTLEVIRPDGSPCLPGEYGEIAVTDLFNRAFPLIRYRLGDRAAWMKDTCACGSTLPLLSKVSGRLTDVLRRPDGGAISGAFLTTIFDDAPEAVSAFNVHQDADYSVTVSFVPRDRAILSHKLPHLERQLLNSFGTAVPIKFIEVDSIPHQDGKPKPVTSDAPPP